MTGIAKYAAFLCVLLASSPAVAQYPNIMVSNPASNDPEEVTIAINPANSRQY